MTPGDKMKYAIVESGGKQYKAVEGETIDVDRLPVEVGSKVELKQVLLTVDGKDVNIGTPTVSGVRVNTTVQSHFKGPKIVVFKYSPRKRMRVRSGHRQQYTRLAVEMIGKPAAKAAKKATEAKATKKPSAPKKATTAKTSKPTPKKPSTRKSTAKTTSKKTTQTKATAKTTAKKQTTKSPAKKTSTTKTDKTTK
jgi:large subunit ribosomal protein L21